MRFLVSPGGFGVLSLVGYVPWGRSQEWGLGVWSGECVVLLVVVVVVSGAGGSRSQSQAEKVKVGGQARSWQGLKVT